VEFYALGTAFIYLFKISASSAGLNSFALFALHFKLSLLPTAYCLLGLLPKVVLEQFFKLLMVFDIYPE